MCNLIKMRGYVCFACHHPLSSNIRIYTVLNLVSWTFGTAIPSILINYRAVASTFEAVRLIDVV